MADSGILSDEFVIGDGPIAKDEFVIGNETSGASKGTENFVIGGPKTPKPKALAENQRPTIVGDEPKVGALEDVGRASLAKFVRGTAAIPGMAGDIPKAFGAEKYVPYTTDEYIEKISSLHPSIRKALAYEAKTDPGRYAGAAAEFIPAAIPAIFTGGAPLYARLAGAAAAGVGSQGVSDYLKKIESPLSGTGYEAAGQFGAALAGGLAGQGLAGKIGGLAKGYQGIAAERLAKEMAKDTASKSAKSPLIGDVAPIAAGGVRTEKLVKNAAARASDESLGAFSGAISDFRQQAVPKVHQTIDDIFGRPVQAFNEMDVLEQRVKDVNNVNYKRVMSLPEAQAINAPELDSIVSAIPTTTISDILENLKIQRIDPTTYGFIKTTKGYELPAQGNSLRAWDEIKQGIDTEINKMYDPVTKSIKPGFGKSALVLTGLKSDLVSVLDKAVEPYKAIRFEASELYGARNAVDAGYKFFADKSPKKIFNIKKLVDEKLSPSQKEEFAYGYAAAYKDALDRVKDDPASALGLYSGKQGSFNADKMKLALGESNANKLLGEINAQYLNSSIRSLAGGTAGGGVGKAAGAGALSAILGESLLVGENLLQGLSFSMAPQAIVGALVAGTARGLYNLRERKIAEQILKLAADPSKYEELGKLISQNKDAGSFLRKFVNSSSRKAPAVFNTPTGEEAAPGKQSDSQAPDLSNLIQRMAQVESRNRQFDEKGLTVTSPKNAVGVMQVTDAAHQDVAKKLGVPFDPQRLRTDEKYNRLIGETYFKMMVDRFKSPELAVAAYNGGPTRVEYALEQSKKRGGQWLDYMRPETQDYYRKVFGKTASATGGRIQRASGGRAGMNHVTRAAMLIRAAERAKNQHGDNTESLLNQPDESIAKALKVANSAI
jgi:soluble lytic murein transglycosylase-like protein